MFYRYYMRKNIPTAIGSNPLLPAYYNAVPLWKGLINHFVMINLLFSIQETSLHDLLETLKRMLENFKKMLTKYLVDNDSYK